MLKQHNYLERTQPPAGIHVTFGGIENGLSFTLFVI